MIRPCPTIPTTDKRDTDGSILPLPRRHLLVRAQWDRRMPASHTRFIKDVNHRNVDPSPLETA
jgi:hypothetical protein